MTGRVEILGDEMPVRGGVSLLYIVMIDHLRYSRRPRRWYFKSGSHHFPFLCFNPARTPWRSGARIFLSRKDLN